MKSRLFRLLGIEHGEESMVAMLLTQSVFLGIFYGAFDISAHSLFLSIFDEKAMARAYVLSGFAGIILTGLYTWFQARIRFKNFAIANLGFVTSLTMLLWLALIFSEAADLKYVIWIVFIMLGPLNIMAMLGFWGTAGRLISLRQGKRLFGLVDAGLIIGIILSCYSIPVLLALNFKSHNILLISTGGIMAAAVIQILIRTRFTFSDEKSGNKEKKRSLFTMFRKDPYIRIMSIFIALSVMTAFFVMYSFMAVTREQYPSEADMARFLGLFTGSMMIFTLLVKILVFSYLIRNYGLKVCLAISPVLVAVFTGIAILVGMSMGFTPATPVPFIFFFLLMALSRLFSKSLKDSIESPSFKVIYQSINENIRFEVQSGIDGTVNEISALSSGLLLAGLGALSFVKLIHFSWVLLAIITVWIFMAFKLYTEYRRSIRRSLESGTSEDVAVAGTKSLGSLKNRAAGTSYFRSEYFKIISGDNSAIEQTCNKWFLEDLMKHAGTRMDQNLLPALKKLKENQKVDELLRNRSAAIIEKIEVTRGDYRKLVDSAHAPAEDEKIINARKVISGERMPQTTEILRLLRDNNPESKRYAIFMIGKFRLKDMLSEVCDCLSIPGLEEDACTVLASFGAEASGELQRVYLNSSGNISTGKAIIRLLGKTRTAENCRFIFARLWSNSRQIKRVALKCLNDCGFKADDEEKDKLNQLISEIIGMITWNISAQVTLARNNDESLLEVVRKETIDWNSFLFDLLSIAYDTGSLARIRANLESGTIESVNYALEMIDLVIDESIKAKLISLVDAVPDEEKLKNLHQFFPGEIPQYDSLIEDILNRDYNLISTWTKAFTLRHMSSLKNENITESVVALLFSPEMILQEEAAGLLGRSEKDLLSRVIKRIPGKQGLRTNKIISGEIPQADLIYEKVRFLSKLFSEIPPDELLILAGVIRYYENRELIAGQELPDSILWIVLPDFKIAASYTIFEGKLPQFSDDQSVSADSICYLLPFTALEDFRKNYPENSFELFSYLDKQEITPTY
jgi:ATP:ADP antiporter, AAA family